MVAGMVTVAVPAIAAAAVATLTLLVPATLSLRVVFSHQAEAQMGILAEELLPSEEPSGTGDEVANT